MDADIPLNNISLLYHVTDNMLSYLIFEPSNKQRNYIDNP